MTISEQIAFAIRIWQTVRNGFTRAIHYLRSLGLPTEFIRWALLGI